MMLRPSELGKLVVVGGPGATGSSTIARILAHKWELHRVDAGEIMRNKTQIQELGDYLVNKVSKTPSIDRGIDQFQVKMSYYPNMLIEGKFFAAIATTMGIACTVKIWITADISSRVHRVLEREGKLDEVKIVKPSSKLYKETRDKIVQRHANDLKRCKKLYHIDLSTPEVFNDIVIDTTKLNIPFTINKIMDEIQSHDELRKRFSPKDLK